MSTPKPDNDLRDIFDTPEVGAAEQKMREAFEKVFNEIAASVEPDTVEVADVYATGYTEDGKQFYVMVDMADGSSRYYSFMAGQRVGYSEYQPPDGKPLHARIETASSGGTTSALVEIESKK